MSKKKKNWNVEMECVVRKDVHFSNCTEDQIRGDIPWERSDDERETELIDWKVLKVEEDK